MPADGPTNTPTQAWLIEGPLSVVGWAEIVEAEQKLGMGRLESTQYQYDGLGIATYELVPRTKSVITQKSPPPESITRILGGLALNEYLLFI